ncbi:hypothetical protein CONLIGDRAFT_694585 [Coniochaeta ligniaria NRRL 30616]|uniref:Lipocalin-like domain-containing protein n=1 Tax=Coniochaeta ligniaria NRRL 30616 TaxID=1408157 RepID=A0A1J7I5F2_9PEZI|nr:hypothetical protein CONLIGDRAFT_694585 [Coniochaeta ligniaria NRRL 30616]
MAVLAGVWNLVSFNYFLNGTSVLQPNGPHPLGKIAIMPEGYVSVQITTPEAAVPIPNGVKWGDATDEEIAAIARPYVSYSGRYQTSYEGEQLVLTTTVDVALDPSWMTRPQRRNVTFVHEDGKQYMLLKPVGTIPMTLPGNVTGDVVSVLKWEKEIGIRADGTMQPLGEQ